MACLNNKHLCRYLVAADLPSGQFLTIVFFVFFYHYSKLVNETDFLYCFKSNRQAVRISVPSYVRSSSTQFRLSERSAFLLYFQYSVPVE